MSHHKLLSTFAVLLTAGAVQLVDLPSADAGVRVRAGGSFSARGSVRVNVGSQTRVAPRAQARVQTRRVQGPRVRRPGYRVYGPRVGIGGHVRVGGWFRFGNPAPVVVYTQPQVEPNYYPIVAEPQPLAYVAPARAPLPRWGLGVFAGAMAVEGQEAGSDLGVAAKLRLSSHFVIDGEVAKSDIGPSGAVSRTDRRLAAGLTYELSPYSAFTPLVLGGFGVTQAEVGNDFQTSQQFGEVGVGLRFAVSPRVHLQADLRAGSRMSIEENDAPLAGQARQVAPPADQSEEYSSLRIGAMVWF